MNSDQLVFLISQPRAGSTMLQSMLNGHADIDTAPEPWLMFTPLYAIKDENITKGYGHKGWRVALETFLDQLPDGRAAYDENIKRMALDLYGRALTKPGNRFLDKTPRYFLIVDDLIRLFPEAHYVVLLRNPLAVLMSMLDTFPHTQQVCIRHASDLIDGPRGLVNALNDHGDRIHTLRYEELVAAPDLHVREVCRHIGVDFDPALIEYGNHQLAETNIGDPKVRSHKRPAAANAERWRDRVTSRERAALCLDYLESLGDDTFRTLGYDADEMRDLLRPRLSYPRELTFAQRTGRYRKAVGDLWSKFRRGPNLYRTDWNQAKTGLGNQDRVAPSY